MYIPGSMILLGIALEHIALMFGCCRWYGPSRASWGVSVFLVKTRFYGRRGCYEVRKTQVGTLLPLQGQAPQPKQLVRTCSFLSAVLVLVLSFCGCCCRAGADAGPGSTFRFAGAAAVLVLVLVQGCHAQKDVMSCEG